MTVSAKGKKDVDTVTFDCSANTADALRYVMYPTSGRLHLLIMNCNLYMEGKKCSELLQYVQQHSQSLNCSKPFALRDFGVQGYLYVTI